jgi:hypothetical protein
MRYPNHGTPAFVRRHPELPAFCRTRRPITTTVRVSTLQQLLWLLWLVLALQLSTILLILTGPIPTPVRPVAMPLVLPPSGPMTAAQRTSVPSPFQP